MIEPPTDASLPTEAVISQAKHAASAEQPDPPFSSTSREDPTSKGKAKQSSPPPSNSSEDRGAGSSVSIPTQGSRSQSQADPDTDLVDSLAKVGLLVSSPPTIPVSVPTAPSSPPSPRPLELTDVVNPEMLEEPGTGSSIVEGSPVAIQPDQWRPDSNWGYRSRSASPVSNYEPAPFRAETSGSQSTVSRILSRSTPRGRGGQKTIRSRGDRAQSSTKKTQSLKRRVSNSEGESEGGRRPRPMIIDDELIFSRTTNQMDLLQNREFGGGR
ncbi:hypothetical protein FRC08_005286 [Ceratobasidium sp. 394]|nr:hypothetical protein FRC08_005286 [Ceratobasidium sp. 394]